MRITIKKEVLIGLVSLGVSFQTLAENKKTYYPTGEVELVKEYAGGKQSKRTIYDKTGKVKEVLEYDAYGKQLKLTIYYDSGVVKGIGEVVNGKISKSTVYYESGKTKRVVAAIDGKISKITVYHKNGKIKSITEY